MKKVHSIESTLIRQQFSAFVRYAFRKTHGESLGDQPYIDHMCYVLSEVIKGKTPRLLINLPPQHLKSFVGTICLAAYLLGINPRLRIIVAAYNDVFAESLCGKIRDIMQSPWYQRAFATRIKDGHSRANDFETREGGGVYAAAATGAITGRSADFVIYDDPHEISDWDNERKLALVKNNFNTLLSRLQDKVNGPIVVIAHRLSENDLSSQLLKEKGWRYLRLPLVADRDRTYELGHDEWTRKKGELLRPKAYPAAEVQRLRRTQVAPPFDLFCQQGVGSSANRRPRAEYFQSFARHEEPIGPVVLSIDPGHGGRQNASRSAVQAWIKSNGNYFLINEFCDLCDAEGLRDVFWHFAKRHRPSVALIEQTADGPALYSRIRDKVAFELKLIVPRGPKIARFDNHLSKIRTRKIFLPETAAWREYFITDLVNFPVETDRGDAMSQYFDYMDSNPAITPRAPRESGIAMVLASSITRRRQ